MFLPALKNVCSPRRTPARLTGALCPVLGYKPSTVRLVVSSTEGVVLQEVPGGAVVFTQRAAGGIPTWTDLSTPGQVWTENK